MTPLNHHYQNAVLNARKLGARLKDAAKADEDNIIASYVN